MKNIILFLIVLFYSCKKEIVSYPANNLEIIFHKPGVNYPMRFGCGWPKNVDSLTENFKFMRVCDKTSVDKFLKIYRKYKIDSTDFRADVRIRILVHQGIKTDTLCLGENFGTIINGESMEDSKELLNFIKQRIEYNKAFTR
ncbi:hypothetical protein [Flavobacterium terrigena]|uniref:Lipoprotein n=1 Tax=Flavobacterium terrigena TaxID=402734 RepID=A0A1H6WC12_9FLAO|nr:hypothetical protein [Flavobacterium terrigena]SEJ09855.1 hypothetical protein SAMN05660918_2360 [Flavobacterium terrigena]